MASRYGNQRSSYTIEVKSQDNMIHGRSEDRANGTTSRFHVNLDYGITCADNQKIRASLHSAQIPLTYYSIDRTNNMFLVQVKSYQYTSDTDFGMSYGIPTDEKNDIHKITIPVGNYDGNSLAAMVTKKMNKAFNINEDTRTWVTHSSVTTDLDNSELHYKHGKNTASEVSVDFYKILLTFKEAELLHDMLTKGNYDHTKDIFVKAVIIGTSSFMQISSSDEKDHTLKQSGSSLIYVQNKTDTRYAKIGSYYLQEDDLVYVHKTNAGATQKEDGIYAVRAVATNNQAFALERKKPFATATTISDSAKIHDMVTGKVYQLSKDFTLDTTTGVDLNEITSNSYCVSGNAKDGPFENHDVEKIIREGHASDELNNSELENNRGYLDNIEMLKRGLLQFGRQTVHDEEAGQMHSDKFFPPIHGKRGTIFDTAHQFIKGSSEGDNKSRFIFTNPKFYCGYNDETETFSIMRVDKGRYFSGGEFRCLFGKLGKVMGFPSLTNQQFKEEINADQQNERYQKFTNSSEQANPVSGVDEKYVDFHSDKIVMYSHLYNERARYVEGDDDGNPQVSDIVDFEKNPRFLAKDGQFVRWHLDGSDNDYDREPQHQYSQRIIAPYQANLSRDILLFKTNLRGNGYDTSTRQPTSTLAVIPVDKNPGEKLFFQNLNPYKSDIGQSARVQGLDITVTDRDNDPIDFRGGDFHFHILLETFDVVSLPIQRPKHQPARASHSEAFDLVDGHFDQEFVTSRDPQMYNTEAETRRRVFNPSRRDRAINNPRTGYRPPMAQQSDQQDQ